MLKIIKVISGLLLLVTFLSFVKLNEEKFYSINTIFANFRLHPSATTNQTEVNITRHPNNHNILFSSAATSKIGGPLFISEGVYTSLNGGLNWFGYDTLPANPITSHNGDPASVIDKNGVFILAHMQFGTNIFSSRSLNNGISWSDNIPVSQTGTDDKCFLTTDDSPLSPYIGRTYIAWTRFIGPFGYIFLSYSTNSGQTWSQPKQVNQSLPDHISHGVDLKTASNGELYLCWANGDRGTQFFEEKYIGFGKSTDGGETWNTNETAFPVKGIRRSPFGNYSVFVTGFPRIDVDKSGGARNGWIYIVTPQKFFGPSKDSADIIINVSTNSGNSWSEGKKVNQDTPDNLRLQFIPAIRVDEGGGVNVIYYDNRNIEYSLAQIYLSRSLDGGNTFEDALVSDHSFALTPIPGFSLPYIGEYIGVTSASGKLFPAWMDNSTGNYQIWTGPVELTVPPLNSFNLLSPLSGDTLITVPHSDSEINFNWTSASQFATYKLKFGIPLIHNLNFSEYSVSTNFKIKSGKLDSILKANNVQQGSTVLAQWDVASYRNNPMIFDSLNSANGPRNIFFKRMMPVLSSFNLISPVNNSSITTYKNFSSEMRFTWESSAEGAVYKWKFNSSGNNIFSFNSNVNGTDTIFSIRISKLDSILSQINLHPGDSITGSWHVTSHNESDSLQSSQQFGITFKRGSNGEILIAYDSSRAGSRNALDSAKKYLNIFNRSYDIVNRKNVNTGPGFSLRSYKIILWLGSGTSTMSQSQRDSLKNYIASGGNTNSTRSKLIIFSQDFAWQHARASSSNFDQELCNQMLGIEFVSDVPPSGGNQRLSGVTLNPGISDSTKGPFPDVISRTITENNDILYRYESDNTINGTGKREPNFRSVLICSDLESIIRSSSSPQGSAIKRFLEAALNYVDGTVGITSTNQETPQEFFISQNFPNPFNPVTKISFGLKSKSLVKIKIYDVLGREIKVLLNEVKDAGIFSINFDGSSLSSGVYFYSIDAASGNVNFSLTRKMVLLK